MSGLDVCGAVNQAFLCSIWNFHEKLCQKQLKKLFSNLFLNPKAKVGCCTANGRDRTAGLDHPLLFQVLNVLSFLVVKSASAQASVASNVKKKELKGKLWFYLRETMGESRKARETPAACTLHNGLLHRMQQTGLHVVQARHHLIVYKFSVMFDN